MINIASSEWIIMKELWKTSPLTSRQIINNIADRTDWNTKTIHTLISRLCKKGAVRAERDEGAYTYLYYANIDEKDCQKNETKSFIDRIYSGSLKNLVSAFVKDNDISDEDISELRKLLDNLEKNKKK